MGINAVAHGVRAQDPQAVARQKVQFEVNAGCHRGGPGSVGVDAGCTQLLAHLVGLAHTMSRFCSVMSVFG